MIIHSGPDLSASHSLPRQWAPGQSGCDVKAPHTFWTAEGPLKCLFVLPRKRAIWVRVEVGSRRQRKTMRRRRRETLESASQLLLSSDPGSPITQSQSHNK